jgi:hypothetical protein
MIITLVEGEGDKRALPVLAQRELGKSPLRCVDMHGKSNIIRLHRGFEDTIRRQHALGGRSFVVLMDGDVTYPPYQSLEEERRQIQQRAQSLADELQVPMWVCWAVLAVESWFIAGIQPRSTYCSLRGVGQVPANTETAPPNPKQWLEDHLRDEYLPRTQECLARRIDLEAAKTRNRSLEIFFGTVEQADKLEGVSL